MSTHKPAEFDRAAYRVCALATIARSAEPLSDAAAFAVDVLAHTPQDIMRDPLERYARLHFAVHAEDQGIPPLDRGALAAALDELAGRGLLPAWCTRLAGRPVTIGGAR